MANKPVEIRDGVFQSKLRKLARKYKIDEKEFIQTQSALLLRDIAKVTPPFNGKPNLRKASIGTKADKIAGEGAIYNDMKVNFTVKDAGYLQHIHDFTGTKRNIRQNLTNKKGVTYLVDVDIINYDSPREALAFHDRQRRKSDGRPKHYQKGGKDTKIGRWQARDKMWITPAIWDITFHTLIKNVGTAKASIAKTMQQINPKQKTPAWIKKQFNRARGHGRLVKTAKGWKAISKSSAFGLNHSQKKLNYLQKVRLEKMEKRMIFLVRENAKKAGFKVRFR